MQRKNLYLYILLTVALIIGSVLLLGSRHSTVQPANQNAATKPSGVQITNTTSISPYLDSESISNVQTALYTRIKLNTPQAATVYTAVVRDWSVRVTTNNNTPILSFMVDIASIKQSYRVEIDGTKGGELYALYVFCPQINQLIYPAFNCQEQN